MEATTTLERADKWTMAMTHIQTSGYSQPQPPPPPPSPPRLQRKEVSYITKSDAFNRLINNPQSASPPSITVPSPKHKSFPNTEYNSAKWHNNPPSISRPASLPKMAPSQSPISPKVTNPFNVQHPPPPMHYHQHPQSPNDHNFGHHHHHQQQHHHQHAPQYPSQQPQHLSICYGDTVRLRDGRDGVVKFIGTIGYRDEIWYGIHLHSQTGNCNGIQQNRLFFQCPPGYGLFIPKHSISTVVQMVNNGTTPRFSIGSRIKCHSGRGAVKFIGEAPIGNSNGRKVLYGVELDKHAHGAHNGIYQNKIYFITDYGRGLFLSEKQIMADDTQTMQQSMSLRHHPNPHHHQQQQQHQLHNIPPNGFHQRQRSPRNMNPPQQQRVFFGPPPNLPPSPRPNAPPIPHYDPPPPPGSPPPSTGPLKPLTLRNAKSNPLYPSNDQKRAHRTHVLRNNTPSFSPKEGKRMKRPNSARRPPSPSFQTPNDVQQQNPHQLHSPKVTDPKPPSMHQAKSLSDDDSDNSSLASSDHEEEVNAALKATNFQYVFEKYKQTTLRKGLLLQPAAKMNVVESPRHHQHIRNHIKYAPNHPNPASLSSKHGSSAMNSNSKSKRMRPFLPREGARGPGIRGPSGNKAAQSLPVTRSNSRVPPPIRQSAMSSGAQPMNQMNPINGSNPPNDFRHFNPQQHGGLIQSQSAIASDPDTTSPTDPKNQNSSSISSMPPPPLQRLDSAPILMPPPPFEKPDRQKLQNQNSKEIPFQPPPPMPRRVRSSEHLPSAAKRKNNKSNHKLADLKAVPDSPFDVRSTYQEFVKCSNHIFGAYNNPRGLFKLLKDMSSNLKLADPKYRILDPSNASVERIVFKRDDTKALQNELGPEYVSEFLKLLGFSTDIESGKMKCPRNQPPLSVIDAATHVCNAFISKCNSSRKALLTIRKYSKNVSDLRKEIAYSLQSRNKNMPSMVTSHNINGVGNPQRMVAVVNKAPNAVNVRYHNKPLPNGSNSTGNGNSNSNGNGNNSNGHQWLSSSMGALNAYSSAESASSGSSYSPSRRTSLGTIAASTTSDHDEGTDPMVINISINTAPSPVTQPLKASPLEAPQEISLGASSKMLDAEDVDDGKKSSFDLNEDEKAVDDDVNGENDRFELRAIVWSATSNDGDHHHIMEVLLLCHPVFTSAKAIMQLLKERFIQKDSDTESEEEHYKIQLRVTAFIKYWITKYYYDDFHLNPYMEALTDEMMDCMRGYFEEHGINHGGTSLADMLEKSINTQHRQLKRNGFMNEHQQRRGKLLNILGVNQDDEALESVKNQKEIDEKQMDRFYGEKNRKIADQLALISASYFQSIQPRECLEQSWKGKEKDQRAPNICKVIKQFNATSRWIQMTILSAHTANKRAKWITKWIKIANKLFDRHDFQTLAAIHGALTSQPIHRLKDAWKKVPAKYIIKFEEFKVIYDMRKNHANLRRFHRETPLPMVPYVGVMLQDLFQIDEGSKSKKKDGSVNFMKLIKLKEKIQDMTLIKQRKYEIEKSEKMERFLINCMSRYAHLSYEDVYQKSVKVLNNDDPKRQGSRLRDISKSAKSLF